MTVRQDICKHCPLRAPGSERLGVDIPRECEANCELFIHLPQLVTTARCVDPIAASFERALESRIRGICDSKQSPCRQTLWKHRRALIRALAKVAGCRS